MNKSKLMILAASMAVMCALGGCSGNASSVKETAAVSAETQDNVELGQTAASSEEESSAETTAVYGEETESAEAEDAFPYLIDNGRLSVDSMFQFSGMNPDRNLEEQDNICSMQVTNVSGQYLEQADVTVTCGHGDTYHFTIEDLPDGVTAYVFDTDNEVCEMQETIQDNTVDSEYNADGMGLLGSDVTASAEGTAVTLTNSGGASYKNLVVRYHDSMDGTLFGGTSYEYTAARMKKGGSISFTAADTVLGEAYVTSVSEK